MLPKLMLLLAFILTLTNIFGYTAIAWWIIGVLVIVPIVIWLCVLAGIGGFGLMWWLNKLDKVL